MYATTTENLATILLCGLVVSAGFRDLVSMIIPNVLVVAVAGLFGLAVLTGLPFPAGVGAHVTMGLVVLAAGFGLFAAGWIGGGDAKLAAATALWLGPSMTVTYVFYTALFGAVLAAGLIVFRRLSLPPQLQTVGWIDRLHTQAAEVPYGVAMAAATCFVLAGSSPSPTL
ncbi:prepilin peptidase [Pelagibacterium sp. H642]|uniref:A24 family peptidase n=1 Tax=Pelagibacterium sp. H642 TaxID=1881069 RepID=UPI002815C855|nr:prepilin peptidase [Pelagibacterium sp. H642]WMT92867.1 prepilin peptidase [Pelagibacterium sp. H642]